MHIICIPSHWWVHIRLHLWFHYNIPAKSMASNRSKSWICFSASHIDTHQWPQTTAQVSGEYNMMPAWKKKRSFCIPKWPMNRCKPVVGTTDTLYTHIVLSSRHCGDIHNRYELLIWNERKWLTQKETKGGGNVSRGGDPQVVHSCVR